MNRKHSFAFSSGAAIGTVGGLIGLGGAEFRLPVLLGFFRFGPLEAVILNKAISLIVVASALPFRTASVPWQSVVAAWPIIANLLAGSLLGAWVGASFATRLRSDVLRRLISVLLAIIAAVLFFAHDPSGGSAPIFLGTPQLVAGVVAGFGIGVIASLMGVAGGEFLIPTLVLLFGIEIKLAGSLSLAISLPTMLSGFARYSRDRSFEVLARTRGFVLAMGAGSVVGTFIGGRLLGIVPGGVLIPGLSLILVVSAVKTWRHSQEPTHRADPQTSSV